MSVFIIILMLIVLVHMGIAFVASMAVLGIPSRFLKFRIIYAACSLLIPFFGLLIIINNGVLLPKLHSAYINMNTHASKGKQSDAGYGHDATTSDSYGEGDGGGGD